MLNLLIDQAKEHFTDKTALVFSGKEYSYLELYKLTCLFASAFIQLGVRPGDAIGLFLSNRPEMILCYLACFKVGAVAMPINQNFSLYQLEPLLFESKPKILITEARLLANLPPISSEFPIYIVEASEESAPFTRSFKQLLEQIKTISDFPVLSKETVATLLYTSGSTARPKGVVHTQEQLYQYLVEHAEIAQYTSQDAVIISVPIAFAYVIANQILPSLYAGASILLVAPGDPSVVLNAIQHLQATLLYTGPTSFIRIIDLIEKTPSFQSRLRGVISSGDIMPLSLHKRAKDLLKANIYEGMGMTETWFYTLSRLDEKPKLGSLGKAAKRMELKIVDEMGESLPPGKVGEIAVRGYSVFRYYLGKPVETIFRDGWFLTGDLAILDEEGFLWCKGRKEQLVLKEGKMIFPHEVEFALYEHPSILEVGVVGVPRLPHGCAIRAYVSFKAEAKIPLIEELFLFIKQRSFSKFIPDEIVVLQQLPRGVTGKIDRKLLRALDP